MDTKILTQLADEPLGDFVKRIQKEFESIKQNSNLTYWEPRVLSVAHCVQGPPSALEHHAIIYYDWFPKTMRSSHEWSG